MIFLLLPILRGEPPITYVHVILLELCMMTLKCERVVICPEIHIFYDTLTGTTIASN